MQRPVTPWLVVLALLSLVCAPGCSRVPPLERTVDARDADELNRWRIGVGAALSPAEWKDFDVAIQELKVKAMTSGKPSGGLSRDEQVLAELQGKTIREALILGWTARRARLELERGYIQEKHDHDSTLKTREGDRESAAYLSNVLKTESDRIAQLTAEGAEAERKLALWGAPAAADAPPAK